MFKRTMRYLHTVRYLRPSQVAARLWIRARRANVRLTPAPLLRTMHRAFLEPPSPAATMLAPRQFRFLNESHSLESAANWNDPRRSKLWLYNLHYFDDLNAAGASARADWHTGLLSRWIRENPPGFGNGWEPYPISRRMVNWIKWSLRGRSLDAEACQSLAVQARWLCRRLEWHLGGNHLLANAKALVYAGTFFEGVEAESWLRTGLRLLERQLAEQILPDGGHVERSPMYHAIVLEDLLDVCNILQAAGLPISETWRGCAVRMGAWLAAMSHPDGEIAFFNDAAFGVAPTLAELRRYAALLLDEAPPQIAGSRLLRDSGYARLECTGAVLLADCGAVGPDHLTGHAHADTLSFEFSLGGERVLVNSGTSVYGTGSERQRQRGTLAHNTVVVDGEDSSEVWSGFRVARRAYPLEVKLERTAVGFSLHAGHDGYRRLLGHNIHRRHWLLEDRRLMVEDTISGPHHSAVARFHLHPNTTVERFDTSAGTAQTRAPSGACIRWRFLRGLQTSIHDSTWHPEFGRSIPSRCLQVAAVDGRIVTEIQWD